jgi:hypothetical protein
MEVVVDSLLDGERTFYALACNPEARHFKFNDLYLLLDEVRAIALEPGLSELLRALLGAQSPVLCNSLTFAKGSAQPMHVDSLFMTPQTPHHLVATWMAFEDVDSAAGPLEYYPRSHEIPLYRFSDGSHHANAEEMPQWSAYIQRELERRGMKKKHLSHAKETCSSGIPTSSTAAAPFKTPARRGSRWFAIITRNRIASAFPNGNWRGSTPGSGSIVCRPRCEPRPIVSTQRIRFRMPRIYAVTPTCVWPFTRAGSHRVSNTTRRMDMQRAGPSDRSCNVPQPLRAEESVNSQMQSTPAMKSATQLAPIGI